MQTKNFQMSKLGLEKEEELGIKLQHSLITEKAREFQKNPYLCFTGYIKAFDYVDHNKLWKALKEMGIPNHLTCLPSNLYAGQEATVPCMEQLTGSRSKKEYNRADCCHPVCLIYMVRTL